MLFPPNPNPVRNPHFFHKIGFTSLPWSVVFTAGFSYIQTIKHNFTSKELFCKELHFPGGPNSRRMAHGSIMMKVILLCAFRSNVIFPFLLPCLDMRRSCPSLIHTMGLFLLVLINVYQYLHFVYACSVCMNCLLTRMSCGTGCTNVMSFFCISSVYTALANNRVGQKTILFDHTF